MTICGKKRTKLTPEGILEMLSPYDIFRYYMPDKEWKFNHSTLSPFRREEHPSFIVGNKYGHITFTDFTSGQHGDCFTFVKLLFSLSNMNETLMKIDQDFGLGISSSPTKEYKRIISEYKQPEELGKRYSLIQVITRKFTQAELDYWAQYHQSLEDLKENNIYSIKAYYLNKVKMSLKDDELRFGYLYQNGYWKIYIPFAEKKRKWLCNAPLTILDEKEPIKECNTLFITKSKKDRLVLQKIYPYVISTQNESVGCFSQKNIEYIKQISKRQILMYDSDESGVRSSLEITKLFNFEYCNVPRMYLKEGIKDWADLGKCHGIDIIKHCLITKGLLS